MENSKLVGPKAGPLKYDILTAISVAGLHGTPTEQTTMIRLSAIITARYNWRLDEITIGQVELARLWGVNERTVKREMKRILNAGVLTCLRPGVRGRVGAYRLSYRRLYEVSRHVWPLIGSDFEERMVELSGEKNVVQVNFKPKLVTEDERSPRSGTWGAVRRHLKAGDPAAFESWFAKLVQEDQTVDSLTLRAPNSFVARYIEVHFAKRLADAVEQEMPTEQGGARRIILVTEN